ncbi:MAG: PilZ domain-containing protein [Oligoflexia bacterium]|nr:PilZ domain-containing protein [Oligoflexia bacterium]
MEQTPERKLISDDLEIIDLFKVIQRDKEKIWAWQQDKLENGVRPVHFVNVRKVDPLKKLIEVIPTTNTDFTYVKGKDLFIYCKAKNIATKITMRELESGYLTFKIPERLNILSEELASKLSIVEKENEEDNAHKREAPRKQADGQMVTVNKTDEAGNIILDDMYTLYDISAGGMGFRVYDPAEFLKGDMVTVPSVNGKDLPNPLRGEVMSVRLMEDEGDIFKVGVRFIK